MKYCKYYSKYRNFGNEECNKLANGNGVFQDWKSVHRMNKSGRTPGGI
jgi:hypothetical protein